MKSYRAWRIELALTILAISGVMAEAYAGVTVCQYTWSEHTTGWRTRVWQKWNCSNGLPDPETWAVGQGQNGNGTSGQVSCTPTTGAHYNHPTVNGPTSGTVRCLFVPPDLDPEQDPSITVCRYNWPEFVVGWRTHPWEPSDCSDGLPPPDAFSVGQGENGNGTSGQVTCTPAEGAHYNHPVRSGPTSATVRCMYVKPYAGEIPDAPVSLCRYTWPEFVTGWRSRIWQGSDCTNGIPTPDYTAVGQGQNGGGTAGEVSCYPNSGWHYNHPTQDGPTSGTVNCMYTRAYPVVPPDPSVYAFDLNGDGIPDTNLDVRRCTADPSQFCLNVDSWLLTPRQIPLGANAFPLSSPPPDIPSRPSISGEVMKVIGDHTGDGFAEVSLLYYQRNGNHLTPALAVLDVDGSRILGASTAPPNLARFNSYDLASFTDYPKDPAGRMYPFLAPGYGDESGSNSWGYLCLFKPQAPANGRCGANFVEVNTKPVGSIPPFDTYYFREVGGYLQGLNGDGWEDIHLIFHGLVYSISTRTGQPMGTTTYDVAYTTEPQSPRWFHSGRNYGTHAAFTGADGRLRTAIVGGVAVGGFDDPFCNVSRFVAALETTPGLPNSRTLRWSRYYGFHSTTFTVIDPRYADNPPIARPADMMNGCIHRFSDSLSTMDGAQTAIFNYFASNTPVDRCVREQYQLYLPPAWTPEKVARWNNCIIKNLKSMGVWGMQVLRSTDGLPMTGSQQTYIWGASDRLLPDREVVYLVEALPARVRFDLSDVAVSRLIVYALRNGLWTLRGEFPVAGRPRIVYVPAQGPRGVGSFTSFAELDLADIDGDGLLDVRLSNGTWVGYSKEKGGFVVKTP